MKHEKLVRLIVMALCCDLGLFGKRLIAPAANIINDVLHIPGGIGTAFSLMFLVIACAAVRKFGCGALMGAVQSVIALAFGMTGSMGVLAPIGYIVPGLVIDCVFFAARRLHIAQTYAAVAANSLASASAALTAQLIVFRLDGAALLIYVVGTAFCGALCGVLGGLTAKKINAVCAAL